MLREDYMLKKVMTCDNFIKYHMSKYKNYCEAIIFPKGSIIYAVPSHSNMLLDIYAAKNKYPRENIWDYISVEDYCLDWILQQTQCVAVWYDHFAFHDLTEKQHATIKKLAEAGCIHSAWKDTSIEDMMYLKTITRGIDRSFCCIPDTLQLCQTQCSKR